MSKFIKYIHLAARLQKTKNNQAMSVPFMEVHKLNSRPPRIDEFNKGPRKVDLAEEFNMKVGDLVQVLYGPDQGKQGVILQINPTKNKIIVEGCTMKKAFWNPTPDEHKPTLVTREGHMHITNVALVDPILKKPTLVKRRSLMNGERVRICKLSGSALPDPIEPEAVKAARTELDLFNMYKSMKTLGASQAERYLLNDEDDKHALARLVTLHEQHEATGDITYAKKSDLPFAVGVSHKWRRDFVSVAELARRVRVSEGSK